MDDFEKHLDEKMKELEFKNAWDSMEAEYNLVKSLIQARNAAGLTQQQLSAKTGIDQAVLSRIETGKANPSIETLKKVAKGLGKQLFIEFR